MRGRRFIRGTAAKRLTSFLPALKGISQGKALYTTKQLPTSIKQADDRALTFRTSLQLAAIFYKQRDMLHSFSICVADFGSGIDWQDVALSGLRAHVSRIKLMITSD